MMKLYTIFQETTAKEKIQRSDFICSLYKVENTSEMKAKLSKHQKENSTATHNCYAYVIGKKQEIQYYSDAGEPSGTAGKPILNALLRANLTNVLAIVTRHYGGIKLGVKGLIEAYGEITSKAIILAKIDDYVERVHFLITASYNELDMIEHFGRKTDILIESVEYGTNVKLKTSCPECFYSDYCSFLDGMKLQSGLEYRLIKTIEE